MYFEFGRNFAGDHYDFLAVDTYSCNVRFDGSRYDLEVVNSFFGRAQADYN